VVDVAQANAVAVLTRAPSSGGKTRLFAALGRPPEPGLPTALLLDTLDGLDACGARVVVAVTPPGGCDEVRALVRPGTEVIPQGDGDVGTRMRAAMHALFAAGAPAVAVVGSDLPGLTAAPVRAAFDILAGDPDALVLGPAADGGYYLIAAARVPPVFEGIRWGGDDVLARTRAAAEARGMRVQLVEALRDVDTLEDLRAWAKGRPGSRTAAWARTSGVV
jgi:rSAM/selenodomain-associated transferase 1